jgi:hypothetical protein
MIVAAIGANSATTGQSFAVIFDMALPPPKWHARELKSGAIGEICATIDGTIASAGGAKKQFPSMAGEAGLPRSASLFMRTLDIRIGRTL